MKKILKKGTIKLLSTLFLLAISISAYNQDNDSISNFVSYSDKFGLYTYGITKFSQFEITDTVIKNTLKYENNGNFNIGLGFNYKWMGVALAFNFKFLNASDIELYGKTNSLDLQVEALTKKYLLTGYLQAYKGYYWSNPDQFYSNWNTRDSLITKPDLVTVNLSLNGIYVFNYERFSFKAVSTCTERQLASAGSWIAGLKTSLYGISSDSSLIPSLISEYYPNASSISGISSISLGGAFGYSYTYIFEEFFYVNLTAMLGFNLQGVSVRNYNGVEINSDSRISKNGLMRLAIGCNKEEVFYGAVLNADSFLIKEPKGSEISYSYGKFRIFYGRRFNLSRG